MRFQDHGKRGVLQFISPSVITEEPGWNVRRESPELHAHIRALADSIREVGVKEPLTVFVEGERMVLTNGHCRLAAVRMLEKEGVTIEQIPVRTEEKTANDADRVASMLVRNSGRPLTPLEQGEVAKRLVAYGWPTSRIAKQAGLTDGYVVQLLALAAAPAEVQGMVARGEVSATLANKVHRKAGKEAPRVLRESLAAAREKGKDKVTQKDLPQPSRPAVAAVPVPPAVEKFMSYVATCKLVNQVEWMEGLVEELNACLASLGDTDRVVFDGQALVVIRNVAGGKG